MELNPNYQHAQLYLPSRKSTISIARPGDYETCRQIMQAASKNYSFASRLFPAYKLKHVEALYALMRIGDDRVDVAHQGFSSPLEAIEEWEQAYTSAFEKGESPHAVIRAYLQTALECGIPRETMSAYFRAMKDDLTITRFATFDHLLYYMDGSAIPVGRAMTHILGVSPSYSLADALPGADSLSVAMQLSNFWRDVGYDWSIGRVYLPQEDLQRFDVREADLAVGKISERLVALLEFEFERTERYYARAAVSVPMLAAGRWAVMSGLEIYHAILSGIRRNGYNVFTRRAGPRALGKLWLAARAFYRTTWS